MLCYRRNFCPENVLQSWNKKPFYRVHSWNFSTLQAFFGLWAIPWKIRRLPLKNSSVVISWIPELPVRTGTWSDRSPGPQKINYSELCLSGGYCWRSGSKTDDENWKFNAEKNNLWSKKKLKKNFTLEKLFDRFFFCDGRKSKSFVDGAMPIRDDSIDSIPN